MMRFERFTSSRIKRDIKRPRAQKEKRIIIYSIICSRTFDPILFVFIMMTYGNTCTRSCAITSSVVNTTWVELPAFGTKLRDIFCVSYTRSGA